MVGKNFCKFDKTKCSHLNTFCKSKVPVIPTVPLFWSVGRVFFLRIINLKPGLPDSQKFPPIQHFRVYFATPCSCKLLKIPSQCLLWTFLQKIHICLFLFSLFDCFLKYLSSRQCVQWLMFYDEINWYIYVLVTSKHVLSTYIWCRLLAFYYEVRRKFCHSFPFSTQKHSEIKLNRSSESLRELRKNMFEFL